MFQPLRILVVDDNRDNADSLAELFEMEGHHSQVAYSGEEAITAYLNTDFDLAFMDVMMPGKNGVESFLEIKRLKPAAKVYMMTGYSVEQLLQQALQNGALGVFGKPVDLDRVMSAIAGAKADGIVLVAEDDPDFGPQLQRLIASTGRRCELVTNGEDALGRMDRGGVEVLILDLNMPLINGIKVCSELRRKGKAVPTVMITGWADHYRSELDALSDIELTGILNKPFDPDALLGRLRSLAAPCGRAPRACLAPERSSQPTP
jgi:CheY-like chemotaxis protein